MADCVAIASAIVRRCGLSLEPKSFRRNDMAEVCRRTTRVSRGGVRPKVDVKWT
jgi:hypothetical protein